MPRCDFIGPARRVGVVTVQTWRLAGRHRLAWFAAGAGLVLVGLARRLALFNFGAPELRFVGEFGFAATAAAGAAFVILLATQLFFDDLAGGALASLAAGPLSRAEYLTGRWCGVASLSAAFVFVQGAVLAGLLARRAAELGVPALSLGVVGQCGVVLVLKLVVLAGGVLGLCSYAGSWIFAAGAGATLAVLGSLAPRPAWLGGRLPEGAEIWLRQAVAGTEAMVTALVVTMAACVVVLGLAVWSLQRREL